MAYYTNSQAVQGILGDNYGAKADGTLPDLVQFIRMADAVIGRLIRMATVKISPVTFSQEELYNLETLLAAHYYCVSDPLYTSRSTQGASGNFQTGTPDEGFGATEYGRQAMAFDYSGCLRQLSKGRRAAMAWLGKPRSQQIPYNQRD